MVWIDAAAMDDVAAEDAFRFDQAGRTYAIYLDDDGALHATDGLCPHDGAHLGGGVLDGPLIECPMCQSLFDIRDGSACGGPARAPLRSYPVRLVSDRVQVRLDDPPVSST